VKQDSWITYWNFTRWLEDGDHCEPAPDPPRRQLSSERVRQIDGVDGTRVNHEHREPDASRPG